MPVFDVFPHARYHMTRSSNLDHEKSKRRLKNHDKVLSIVGLIFGGLLLSILLFGDWFDYCEHIEEIKKNEFEGVIEEKIHQKWNHGFLALKIKASGEKDLQVWLNNDNNRGSNGLSKLWLEVEVGDSILKRAGTFEFSYQNKKKVWKSIKTEYDENSCRD
jgi:hypothetical protein